MINVKSKYIIALFSSALMSLNIAADDGDSNKSYAIVGGTVHTMSDKKIMENATILIKDGKIKNIAENARPPSTYEVIDAKGKVVTPGLIGAYTSLGLVDVGLSAGTVDATSTKSMVSPTGAALDVSYGVNPDSALIPVNRIEGVTLAATAMVQTETLFRGQGAIITLQDNADVIKPRAFMVTGVDHGAASQNGGSRAALFVALTQALSEAEYAARTKLTPITQWHGVTSLADAKALIPVVKGSTPLLVDARRAADIKQVIALKKQFKSLDLAILNATEGWKVAKLLAEANIPVVLNPEANLPSSFDQLGATLANAGRLHAAGVVVSIGMSTHNIRLATQHAGNAVANGLPWEAGLAALTINPAKLYGIDKDYGSVEPGKVADLVIWSSDPLELMETAEAVFINGEPIEMESRQTKLRDRYLDLNKTKPVQYTRP